MKTCLFISILLFSFHSYAIVGGQLVPKGHPVEQSTVALSTGCTGTLISDRLVLTAAHCIINPRVSIVFGTSRSSQVRVPVIDGRIHAGLNLVNRLHPSQPGSVPVNDIAVLKMAAPAPAGYTPARLGLEQNLQNGDQLILAGYGLSQRPQPPIQTPFGLIPSPQPPSDGLLRAVSTVFNFYNNAAKEIVFGHTPGRSACAGDSGGPMYIVVDNELVVIGVTSGGFSFLGPCSGSGNYSDTAAHADWLEQVINALQ